MLRVYGGSVFFNPLRGAEVRRPLLLFISIALTISGESFTVDVCGQGDIYLYIYIKKGVCDVFNPEIPFFLLRGEAVDSSEPRGVYG